ncbi:NAD-dependent epimerase/dehydratase family protein [Flavobacterium sp. XS1P27]|uniref:NAD-dependent epimerase/dehydratase family protein n=1 Tax=Flavobacterium sp. XS1P27 TaxID=3401724 RepID=UPI003AAC5506
MKKKISITGLTGFVGKNLEKYLNDDFDIEGLKLRYSENQSIIIDSDVIIHLAGKAHDLKKVSSPKDYFDANYQLTKQVFDAFIQSKASVFIYMSSVKAVADKVSGILTENDSCNPETYYGKSKRKAEEYILLKTLPSNKRIYILRPCMIHGPRNKGNLNLLYELVSKGLPWPLGAFENQRSFLSIENLCFVIKELLVNISIPSGVYQVSDDKSLSTNQLIELLGTSLGKKSTIWSIPRSWIGSLAKLGDYLYLPLNSERLQKLTENYVVSNNKIVMAIGKELPVSVQEGLSKTFKSFNDK